ncbi:unnamed protein product [Rhizophagus irregularis]|uniref:Uncharacterized protein n=1 Tax=Rhizophagus irregularis TaxID=588596 RepID=A0A2N1NA23_9GLOM|nr:hypothetical protein RhiirC2_779299 [Rhizophagus irregularis]CAB4392687.1 unnamed protein product [Rhizophagus irregularis]CAB5350941.1 unnamed protein product [Rhizophagus irregularis]
MIYSGFSLKILVNNKPLKECSEHINKRIMTTGPSYVLDMKTGRKIKSDKIYYAAVEELGTNYVVQFGASSNHFSSSSSCIILKAKLFIDGKWDHTCKQIQKSTPKSRKDGFFDEKRQKHLFKFDVTNWINDNNEVDSNNNNNNNNNIKYSSTKSIFGGIGAISVYFYIVEEVEKLDNYVKNQVEKVQVPESTGIEMGIKISTGFQKSQDIKMASNKMLKSILTIPVAVLHIHYRPASWLRTRNILLDDVPIKIEKEGELEIIKTEEKEIKVKNEFIKNEFEVVKSEEKVKSEFVKNEFEAIKTEEKEIKVKRNFSEFIEAEESKQEAQKKIKIEDNV